MIPRPGRGYLFGGQKYKNNGANPRRYCVSMVGHQGLEPGTP
jgi:hypothetical protein